MRHAEVEGAQRDSPGGGRIIDAPEVMPEPKRDLWEMQARFTAACLEGRVGIAGGAGGVHTDEKTVPVPLSQRENPRPCFQATTSRPNVFSLIANFFGRTNQEGAVREGYRDGLIG